MKVIVDTSVWSLALRRKNRIDPPVVNALEELITDGRVQMIGAIRQEILSGVKSEAQFNRLRNVLRAFPDLNHSPDDYELAARFYTTCRSAGVQGSNTDFLICAAAVRHDMNIFTNDNDFTLFQKHIDISIYTGAPH
ncbi:MAG: PIN domain-containing protein [Desulfobacteraceae bacterium]|nr:PIN domain-containing protein [Desulfobacteraceae bacterium]